MPVLGVDQKEGSRLVTYFPLVFDFVHKLIQSLGITVKMYIMIFLKYAIIFFKNCIIQISFFLWNHILCNNHLMK